MRILLASLTALAVSACGPETVSKTSDPCAAVERIQTARLDKEPFESMRGDNIMLGDNPLDDSWVTSTDLFGKSCRVSAMRNFFGNDLHILNCSLYAATGSLNKEENEAKARKAVTEVREELTQCLGDSWEISETSESSDYDIYQKITFEQTEPDKDTEDFEFRADPLYIEMSYSPFMRGRGGPTGWIAEVQFQEQVKIEK